MHILKYNSTKVSYILRYNSARVLYISWYISARVLYISRYTSARVLYISGQESWFKIAENHFKKFRLDGFDNMYRYLWHGLDDKLRF